MLVLYHNPVSSTSQKVRLVLAEKGAKYESRVLDLRAGDQFTAEYLARNPHGVVPTLEHDGRALIESTVINEFLDDLIPEPPLRPADPMQRARMRLLTKILDDHLHLDVYTISVGAAFRHEYLAKPKELCEHLVQSKPHVQDRELLQDLLDHGMDSRFIPGAATRTESTLTAINSQLCATPWLSGDAYSLADAGYTPYIQRLELLGMGEWWRNDREALVAWWQRITARASFAAEIADVAPADKLAALAERGHAAWPTVQRFLT